jgi:hypothetical protein
MPPETPIASPVTKEAAGGIAAYLGNDDTIETDQRADRHLQIGGDLAPEIAELFALGRKLADVASGTEIRSVAAKMNHPPPRIAMATHHCLMKRARRPVLA